MTKNFKYWIIWAKISSELINLVSENNHIVHNPKPRRNTQIMNIVKPRNCPIMYVFIIHLLCKASGNIELKYNMQWPVDYVALQKYKIKNLASEKLQYTVAFLIFATHRITQPDKISFLATMSPVFT